MGIRSYCHLEEIQGTTLHHNRNETRIATNNQMKWALNINSRNTIIVTAHRIH